MSKDRTYSARPKTGWTTQYDVSPDEVGAHFANYRATWMRTNEATIAERGGIEQVEAYERMVRVRLLTDLVAKALRAAGHVARVQGHNRINTLADEATVRATIATVPTGTYKFNAWGR